MMALYDCILHIHMSSSYTCPRASQFRFVVCVLRVFLSDYISRRFMFCLRFCVYFLLVVVCLVVGTSVVGVAWWCYR